MMSYEYGSMGFNTNLSSQGVCCLIGDRFYKWIFAGHTCFFIKWLCRGACKRVLNPNGTI
jgi:hypothetical protein